MEGPLSSPSANRGISKWQVVVLLLSISKGVPRMISLPLFRRSPSLPTRIKVDSGAIFPLDASQPA